MPNVTPRGLWARTPAAAWAPAVDVFVYAAGWQPVKDVWAFDGVTWNIVWSRGAGKPYAVTAARVTGPPAGVQVCWSIPGSADLGVRPQPGGLWDDGLWDDAVWAGSQPVASEGWAVRRQPGNTLVATAKVGETCVFDSAPGTVQQYTVAGVLGGVEGPSVPSNRVPPA